MMPPPNVTGSLHMGHALTFTLQDILIRYHRMRGRDALWQPGTDHAGIATQMVVERQLARGAVQPPASSAARPSSSASGNGRRNRAAPSSRQLRALGASPDWRRERFTMDEGLSAAVRKVFVALHKAGPHLSRQAAGQLGPEAPHRDFRSRGREPRDQGLALVFPLSDRGRAPARSSSSPPRGPRRCSATPASPSIPRTSATSTWSAAMRAAAGRAAHSRSSPTTMPIPQTGSGAVKITPAHDFNDFEVGRRHGLRAHQHLRPGRAAQRRRRPKPIRGLDRFEARKRVVGGAGGGRGSSRRSSRILCMVPHGDRSGAVIEPWLTDQWYCRRQDAGAAGDRRGRERAHRLRAEDVGEHVLRMDAQHPALVHLAPALVGPSDPGLVRARRRRLRRGDRGRGRGGGARHYGKAVAAHARRATCSTPGSPRRSGRSRPWAGPSRRRSSRATTRPTCWSPASTSSSSGSRG